MRLLGILLAIAGAVALVRSVRGTLEHKRPKDVAYALLGLFATVITLLGLALVFAPGFLG